ncbi:unnamed protein product, partial [Meganyctiphanes norvegica]
MLESYITTTELHRPRCLLCGHTLCGVCATRLLINGKLRCPVCQQIYKYDNLNKISINHELEDVIETLVSASTLTLTEKIAPTSDQATVPKDGLKITLTAPKLNYGICDWHGLFKVHHCLTHDIFICSECALSYHFEGNCSCVPIEKVLNDRKSDLSMKIDSHMSDLQETCRQVQESDRQFEWYFNILNETELKIENKIENLQSDVKTIKQQMKIHQNLSSKYKKLVSEYEDRQKQTQHIKNQIQSISTFQELDNEVQLMNSTECEAQDRNKQVIDTLKQQ